MIGGGVDRELVRRAIPAANGHKPDGLGGINPRRGFVWQGAASGNHEERKWNSKFSGELKMERILKSKKSAATASLKRKSRQVALPDYAAVGVIWIARRFITAPTGMDFGTSRTGNSALGFKVITPTSARTYSPQPPVPATMSGSC